MIFNTARFVRVIVRCSYVAGRDFGDEMCLQNKYQTFKLDVNKKSCEYVLCHENGTMTSHKCPEDGDGVCSDYRFSYKAQMCV